MPHQLGSAAESAKQTLPVQTPTATPAGPQAPQVSLEEQQKTELIARATAGLASQFQDTFNRAGSTLGQPNTPSAVVSGGVNSLAVNFMRKAEAEGRVLPTESQIQDFVAQQLTQDFARDVIQGGAQGTDIAIQQLASPFVQGLEGKGDPAGDQVQSEVLKRQEAELRTKFEELFGRIEKTGAESIRQSFVDPARRFEESEAAFGRRGSPVASIGRARLAGEEAQAQAGLAGQIAQARIQPELQTFRDIEGLLAGERRAGEQGRQFQQDLGFRRQGLAANIKQEDANRKLRAMLGQAQLAEQVRVREDRRPGLGARVGQGIDLTQKTVNLGTSVFGTGKRGGLQR